MVRFSRRFGCLYLLMNYVVTGLTLVTPDKDTSITDYGELHLDLRNSD